MLMARGADRVVEFANSLSMPEAQDLQLTFQGLDTKHYRKALDEHFLLVQQPDGQNLRLRISRELHRSLQHPAPGMSWTAGQTVTLRMAYGSLGLAGVDSVKR